MIGLLVVFLVAAAVCARLGVWQLDRAQQRAELAAQQEAAEVAAEGPEGLGVLLPPQSTFPGELVGRQAWVEGEEVLPDGQTDSISTGSLVNAWGGPMYSGYLVLISSDPPQASPDDGGPALLPRPTIEGGTGLNLQNLFYALQWWVFGGFAVLLWLRLVRDEAAGVRRGSRGDDDGIAGLPGDRQIDPSAPTSTL
jgi:hypothetical protein